MIFYLSNKPFLMVLIHILFMYHCQITDLPLLSAHDTHLLWDEKHRHLYTYVQCVVQLKPVSSCDIPKSILLSSMLMKNSLG